MNEEKIKNKVNRIKGTKSKKYFLKKSFSELQIPNLYLKKTKGLPDTSLLQSMILLLPFEMNKFRGCSYLFLLTIFSPSAYLTGKSDLPSETISSNH